MIANQNVIAQVLQVRLITPPDLQRILAVLPIFHSKSVQDPTLAVMKCLIFRSHRISARPPSPYYD